VRADELNYLFRVLDHLDVLDLWLIQYRLEHNTEAEASDQDSAIRHSNWFHVIPKFNRRVAHHNMTTAHEARIRSGSDPSRTRADARAEIRKSRIALRHHEPLDAPIAALTFWHINHPE